MQLPTQKIHSVLTLLLAFSLPFERQIPPVIIALLLLNWLIEWNWKDKISNYKSHRLSLLPSVLFLLYCLGMIFTENTDYGSKDLGMKLSFLILPLIFASKKPLTKEEIHKILQYFTYACLLAAVICLGHSLYEYFDEIRQVKQGILKDNYVNANFFFSSMLSWFMHPSYFAMYLCLCIVFLLAVLFSPEALHTSRFKSYLIVLILIFSVFVLFLASRMGIIVLTLTWLCTILYVVVRKKYYLAGVSALLLIIVSFFILYKNSDILASRIDLTLHTLETKNLDKTSSESSTVRMLIWHQALDLIKDSPITGVGTGDIKDKLLEKYRTEGMTGALEHKLNAHNQFLQTGIALGIPGLLLLLFTVLSPLLIRKHRSLLFGFFSLCILLNFSVESMLEVQVGIIFFSFFFSIFSTARLQEINE